uniref:Somatostatin/Cortistatin C-terminal domain-containing protein n=1 Tax=Oryzias sinensis TaxID=183150 RepID=A0A8C7WRM6_9TELE
MLGSQVQMLLADPTCLLLMKLLLELVALRRQEMLQELEEEEVGGRERLMKRHIRFTQRERKAGCRNFFWKTFTSC